MNLRQLITEIVSRDYLKLEDTAIVRIIERDDGNVVIRDSCNIITRVDAEGRFIIESSLIKFKEC